MCEGEGEQCVWECEGDQCLRVRVNSEGEQCV